MLLFFGRAFRILIFGSFFLTLSSLCAQQMSSAGLRVTLVSSHWSGNGDRGTFDVQLRLQNITNESPNPRLLAVAISKLRAQLGVVDIMKRSQFGMPIPDSIPKAYLADAFGATWTPVQATGLPYGENTNDWITLRPGGSTPASIRFDTTERYSPPFNFNAELKLYEFDQRPHRTIPIHFGPIEESQPAH